MKLINKEGRIIHATEKTYQYLYKKRGYRKIEPSEPTRNKKKIGTNTTGIAKSEGPTLADKLAQKTNDELKQILEEHGIKYGRNPRKDRLISLILENMEG